MAKVSELKERARALEQQGKVSEALAIYRHILNHLERTPAIKHELPLYVKVGDLSLKLGNPTWAISMYERAAGHYVQTGSAKTIISLCHKIVRVDESRVGLFREYADRLVAGGQLQAAVAVLQEYAKRVKQPEAFVRLQGVVDRPDDEARRGIQDALAELDGKPVAPAAPVRAEAPPPLVGTPPGKPPIQPAGIGLITEPQFDAGAQGGKRRAEQPPVARADVPVAKVPAQPRFAPPPPPAPPPPRESPPIQLEPGPFAPPSERRARASGPHRAAEPERPPTARESSPPAPERRPVAKVVTKTGPTGGRVVVAERQAHKGRLLWIGGGVAAVVLVTVGLVLTLGKRSRTGGREPGQQATTTVPPRPTAAPAESVAAPAPVAQAAPDRHGTRRGASRPGHGAGGAPAGLPTRAGAAGPGGHPHPGAPSGSRPAGTRHGAAAGGCQRDRCVRRDRRTADRQRE